MRAPGPKHGRALPPRRLGLVAAVAVALLTACTGGAPEAGESASTQTPESSALPTSAPTVDVEAVRAAAGDAGPPEAPVVWEDLVDTGGVEDEVARAVQAFTVQEARVLAADDPLEPGRDWAAFATEDELALRWEDVRKERVPPTVGPTWFRPLGQVTPVGRDTWSWLTCTDLGLRQAPDGQPPVPRARAERAYQVTYDVVREQVAGADVYRVAAVSATGAVPPIEDDAERTCYDWAVHEG